MEEPLLSHQEQQDQEHQLPPVPEDGDLKGLREIKEEIVYGSPCPELLLSFRSDPGSAPAAAQASPSNQRSPRKLLNKSRTAPAMIARAEADNSSNKKTSSKPALASSSRIVQRLAIGVLLYIFTGAIIYLWKPDQFTGSKTGFTLVDALYFSIVTISTTGYGDIAPSSPFTKLSFCAFVLLGFGVSDVLINGITTFILERHEVLLIGVVESSDHLRNARKYMLTTERRMRNRLKVALALMVVFTNLAFGTVCVKFLEGLSWMNSFYLVCMSVTTVGYGDYSFRTTRGRLFASLWLLVSSVAVTRAYIFLAEFRIERRNQAIAKWVIGRGVPAKDLVDADLDNDWKLSSKSEFVVYKLKQLRKISEEDVNEVSDQFQVLDPDNSGRITLSCLSNAEKSD